ncbi:hypothetical protein GF340_02660 [Candidatus Peregrinibacteria bacterium]|nr:hypothetical protein [Candidatus Peregrinibacteria bacterium]
MAFNTPNYTPQLGEKYEQKQELIKERVNSGPIAFIDDVKQNIDQLASAVYKNPEEQKRYRGKIEASIRSWLMPGVTMENLWQDLKERNCTTTQIIAGLLKFYDGQNNEIGLNKYLKPLEFKATSTLDKAADTLKTETLAKTRASLQDLLAEIKAENPNLDPA